MKIAPSILSADFANLAKDIELVEQYGVDYIHVDVMDGQFVPNITFGPSMVTSLKQVTQLPLDVHLMIVEPERFILDFAKAGADIISIHVESTPHIHRALQMIQQAGVKAGVVVNPGTPITMIEPVLSMVDLVLVMTVNPGFGGQQFIPETLNKIEKLKVLKETNGYNYEIEVDGGITLDTAQLCRDAGAEVFVAGSYIYNSSDVGSSIQALKEIVS